MIVNQIPYRTIWFKSDDSDIVCIIDQRFLPHQFIIEEISTVEQMITAINEMHLRGAGLIGVAAAYGMYLASLEAENELSFEYSIKQSAFKFIGSRPTAVNLIWAVNRQLKAVSNIKSLDLVKSISRKLAISMADEDASNCRNIGEYGVKLIEEIYDKKHGASVNILTHCNAGWLAFVDYGSATAPIYEALRRGIPVHVWVDETRP